MKIGKYSSCILCMAALSFISGSCENRHKDHFIPPLKKEMLSESRLNEIDHMLLAWTHTEWETPPEADFLKKINKPANVQGIVTLWTHTIPAHQDKDFSLILNDFYKMAQPLSIDGKIMTGKDESRAYVNTKDGVFLVYKNKEDGKSECAVFYRKIKN